jgi:mannonate dehydratase
VGTGLCAACLGPAAHALKLGLDEGAPLMNPCSGALPAALSEHELVRAAFAGLDARQLWDCHAHLLGNGDSGSGCWLNPRLESVLYPRQFLQRKFFLNAACVDEKDFRVDHDFVARLAAHANAFPVGAGLMLLAFDQTYREDGGLDKSHAAFHVPNAYAAQIASANPSRFRFVCSVHPYRRDVEQALRRAAADGAVAVKWLPSAMGIDPGSPHCDRFYVEAAKLALPLITHAGQERAVKGAHQQHFGNPLRLRRALEHGVKVVVAHCATMGEDRDLDRGPSGRYVESFELFSRLMDEPKWQGRLFGDISAIVQTNRATYLPKIIARDDWHGRLLNGSDYPLPGVMPLFSVDNMVEQRWLSARDAGVIKQLREYNPLVFDFVLKRTLRINGRKLPDAIFETGKFVHRQSA